MENLKILYYFENEDVMLLETKREDLPPESPPSKQYSWLLVARGSGSITKLNFVSMDKSATAESRAFKEGEFHFNSEGGHLALRASEFALKRLPPEAVSPLTREAVQKFIF